MRRTEDRILDEFLAASARAGDRPSFEALGRRWEKRLLAHAWRLTGDLELARDVAQDAWADITRRIRSLDDTAAFHAWAFRIVTRRAADAIGRNRRKRAGLTAFAAEPCEDHGTSERLDAAASAPSIAAALERLPAEQRAAIALFYLEDMSVAEIAAALDVPAGTVKTRLMTARDKLRIALGIPTEKSHE